jgi:hypothetical protein
MTASRSRLIFISAVTAGAAAIGTAAASAITVRATPKHITPSGVGGVKLGKTYTSLHAAGLVATIGPGCEFAGPNARSAKLRAPLKGSVDFTQTTPRKVVDIFITGGATARGVGIGATQAKVKQAFPKMVVDHSTDSVFGITLLKIPSSGGGKLQFALDTKTKKVTAIGVPFVPFCD